MYFAHAKCEDKLNIKKVYRGETFLDCQEALPQSTMEVQSSIFSFCLESKEITKGGEKSLCEHEPV